MSNQRHGQRPTNYNQQPTPPKKKRTGLIVAGSVATAAIVGGIAGAFFNELSNADEVRAADESRKQKSTTTRPTTTTTTPPRITSETTTTTTETTTTTSQSKEVVDPRDAKLRQRAALFSGCKVMNIYDEGGAIKLDITTSINADSFNARKAHSNEVGSSMYGSGVAIYQTDATGAIINQSPVVRTEIGPGGSDYAAEHPTVSLPKVEGAHYEVSVTTGAAIGDKPLVNAVACTVISVEDGRWGITDVPAMSGSRTLS